MKIPALAVLALLAVSGCAGPAPAPEAAQAPSTAVSAPAPSPAPVDPAASFPEWLSVNYPGVSWGPLVTAAETKSGALWISTEIFPDAEGRTMAAPVCSAGRAFSLDHDFQEVTVRGAGGKEVASC